MAEDRTISMRWQSPYLIRLMSEKSTNRTPRKNGYWRFNQKLSLILIGSILGTLAISKTYSEGPDFRSCTSFLCIKSKRSQSKHSPKSKYPQGPNHKSSKSPQQFAKMVIKLLSLCPPLQSNIHSRRSFL